MLRASAGGGSEAPLGGNLSAAAFQVGRRWHYHQPMPHAPPIAVNASAACPWLARPWRSSHHKAAAVAPMPAFLYLALFSAALLSAVSWWALGGHGGGAVGAPQRLHEHQHQLQQPQLQHQLEQRQLEKEKQQQQQHHEKEPPPPPQQQQQQQHHEKKPPPPPPHQQQQRQQQQQHHEKKPPAPQQQQQQQQQQLLPQHQKKQQQQQQQKTMRQGQQKNKKEQQQNKKVQQQRLKRKREQYRQQQQQQQQKKKKQREKQQQQQQQKQQQEQQQEQKEKSSAIVEEEQDDNGLIRRALSADKTADNSSSTRQKKVAFLFLTRGPLPLAPLWARFFDGDFLQGVSGVSAGESRFSIYVHATPGHRYGAHELPPVFAGRTIPSKSVRRCHFSMVTAMLRLLANAMLDQSNTRFVLLSEVCIPLYNFSFVYDHLVASPHSGHIPSHLRFNESGWMDAFSPQLSKQDFRKGSMWFEMGRGLARVILSRTKFHTAFSEICSKRRVSVPEEFYIPTLLHVLESKLNSTHVFEQQLQQEEEEEQEQLRLLSSVSTKELMFVDWSRQSGSHPSAFNTSSVVEAGLLTRLRGGNSCEHWKAGAPDVDPGWCHLFARKFLPDTLEPLMRLDYL